MYGLCLLFISRVVIRHSRYYSSHNSKKLLEILAKMPKANSVRIAEAQNQRLKITKKSEKYGPSTVYLQVLGSGAMGVPNTLYLFTDQKRYLFNCGECTQRLAHEHKVKLSKLDHIFITRKSWQNIGGLPGLSLTLQDVGVPNITLHGPDGLDELYNATKRFVIMKDMQVTMANCNPTNDFEDNVMTVRYVVLEKDPTTSPTSLLRRKAHKPKVDNEFIEFINDQTDYYKVQKINERDRKAFRNDNKKPDSKKKTENIPLQNTDCSIAFICKLKKRLGTLDLAKCVEFGVPPGPLLGQLKNGIDVVLPNGKLVKSEMVKTPDESGPVFIVLEVPEISYLKLEEFNPYFQNQINPPENIPVLIVHLSPPHVLHHPMYVQFMSLFGPTTRHLVVNSNNSCMGSEAVHRTQHKLHLLDPDIFPLLRDLSIPAVWNAPLVSQKPASAIKMKGLEELKNKIAFAQFQSIVMMESSSKAEGQFIVEDPETNLKVETLAGKTLTMFHLRPNKLLDRSSEPKLHIQDYISETMNTDGFADSLQYYQRLVESMKYTKIDSKEYPKVVFLGTGSCIPSKTRNTSAILIYVNKERSILLDCGEGTIGQLVRFYGPKNVNACLRTIKGIYISHLHADHHIGLIGVLQARWQAFQEMNEEKPEPVYLLAPGQIVTWLTLYDSQFESIKHSYTLIPNQTLLQEDPSLSAAALSALGVESVRTCPVAHCPNAFGLALQLTQEYKLTYSGDTVPCQELVRIGENSTLLIHEATMEDDLSLEARIKMHSTTSQAIDIGRQMNAQYTILTHFSQRYARLPRLNATILNNNQTIGIAFDNMQITWSDLQLLPHMYAPLAMMFAEHCVEMELKASNRQRRPQAEPEPAQPDPVQPDPAPLDDEQSQSSTYSKESANKNQLGDQLTVTQRYNSSFLRRTQYVSYRESTASKLRRKVIGKQVSNPANETDSVYLRSRSNVRPLKNLNIPEFKQDVIDKEVANPGNDTESDNLRSRSIVRGPKYSNTPELKPEVIGKQVANPENNTESHNLRGRSTNRAPKSSNIPVSATLTKRPRSYDVKRPLTPETPTTTRNNLDLRKSPQPQRPRSLNLRRSVTPNPPSAHTRTEMTNFGAEVLQRCKIMSQPVIDSRSQIMIPGTGIRPTKELLNTVNTVKRTSLLPVPKSPPTNDKITDNTTKTCFKPVTSVEQKMPRNTETLSRPKQLKREAFNNILANSPSEMARKMLLLEAKKKYKSKDYWVQSKYDKIEGLNWISWK